jgi:predicted dinucleotide-binding enzyme
VAAAVRGNERAIQAVFSHSLGHDSDFSSPEGDMKIGIIGSSTVAQTLATKLVEVGHSVTISSRDTSKAKDRGPMGVLPSADDWAAEQRARGYEAAAAGFADTAASGELLINATAGTGSLPALRAAGADNLRGKILVDVSNPLDFSNGMPPTLTVCNTDSLAEQIQAAFPEARVVKSLNTVTSAVMVDPLSLAGGEHAMFVCGDDDGAKAEVTALLQQLGWRHIVDLGDLTAARALEMYVPLWLRLYQTLGTPMVNVAVVG